MRRRVDAMSSQRSTRLRPRCARSLALRRSARAHRSPRSLRRRALCARCACRATSTGEAWLREWLAAGGDVTSLRTALMVPRGAPAERDVAARRASCAAATASPSTRSPRDRSAARARAARRSRVAGRAAVRHGLRLVRAGVASSSSPHAHAQSGSPHEARGRVVPRRRRARAIRSSSRSRPCARSRTADVVLHDDLVAGRSSLTCGRMRASSPSASAADAARRRRRSSSSS